MKEEGKGMGKAAHLQSTDPFRKGAGAKIHISGPYEILTPKSPQLLVTICLQLPLKSLVPSGSNHLAIVPPTGVQSFQFVDLSKNTSYP